MTDSNVLFSVGIAHLTREITREIMLTLKERRANDL